jgi:hypothetical protein
MACKSYTARSAVTRDANKSFAESAARIAAEENRLRIKTRTALPAIGEIMKPNILRTFALACLALIVVPNVPSRAQAQEAKSAYASMAPLDRYLMAQDAEIALARSAAPKSLSDDAEVMVLGRHGYETVIKGKNNFVCVVERGWTAGIDNPDFWNPKLRGPICFNPAAARTYLPITIKKTELVLAGQSKTQMFESLKAAFVKKELPPLEAGAMCYMLSKQQYLNDKGDNWHPHLMFFIPLAAPATWGANLADTPVAASEMPQDRLTIFMVPVSTWSDGTPDPNAGH